jgi:hypothetical protein
LLVASSVVAQLRKTKGPLIERAFQLVVSICVWLFEARHEKTRDSHRGFSFDIYRNLAPEVGLEPTTP